MPYGANKENFRLLAVDRKNRKKIACRQAALGALAVYQ